MGVGVASQMVPMCIAPGRPIGAVVPPTNPLVTGITPNPMATGNPAVAVVVTGSNFQAGLTVRFWDGAGTFRGTLTPDTVAADQVNVTVDTRGWATGTGGVDVYQAGGPSNQYQFTLN